MNEEQRKLDEKFLTSGQASVKLAVALQRYFQLEEEEAELKKRYGDYLAIRLRPAAEELIKNRENQKLRKLLEENKVSSSVLDELIHMAGIWKNHEVQIYLLGKKKSEWNSREQEWEL